MEILSTIIKLQIFIRIGCSAFLSEFIVNNKVTRLMTSQPAITCSNLRIETLSEFIVNNKVTRLMTSQPAITCSNLRIETLEHGLKYAQT